ncbi:cathepsin f [Plakobranchus ocellatus]|uniref:Cathepsin f n=1 Tax=Plakobranchus ocellatus TaxID=259542 RepID=A0AAV3ZR39_9GAST|nr:cathepsin f [Plakobranchus ocellatus]
MTSWLGSMGQCCPAVLCRKKGVVKELCMGDSHYYRTVTPGSTPHPIRVTPHGKQGANTITTTRKIFVLSLCWHCGHLRYQVKETKMQMFLRVSLLILLLSLAHHVNSGLVGGYREHPLNLLRAREKGQYIEVANKAIKLMNDVKRTDGEGNVINTVPLTLEELISVRTQVVAGVNYDMVLKIQIDGKSEHCHLLVTNMLNTPVRGGVWSVEAQSANDPCAPFAPLEPRLRIQKRSLLGGEHQASAEDKGVKAAAQWSLEHINSMSNSMYRQVLVRVSNVRKQVVNGYRYRFQLTTAPSGCRNNLENKNKGLEECPVTNFAKAQDCEISVIYSLGKYEMETFSCNPSDQKIFLGGDGHDYKPHGILGGDDHDYKPHGILGGDDHDYKNHGERVQHLLGKNLRDFLPHGRPYYGLPPKKMMNQNLVEKGITHMQIGGDDHDYLPHGNNKCTQYEDQFETFKAKHKKMYKLPEDEAYRFKVFCENMEKVKQYQAQERGSAVYGATKFADLTEAEFKKQYLGLKPLSSAHGLAWPSAKIPGGSFPNSWDWRDHNAVTPVKNQGSCGSCWAFSTTGNIEGQWALTNKKLYSLSEQELVDCDKIDEGCNGGLPSQAYEAIMKLGGLETEKDYKYDGHDEKCTFNKTKVVVTLQGAVNISQNETEMAVWLYKNGPISIGINAFAMQFYFGGIAHPWKIFCDPSSLDHGVLIVGYGVEKGEPFWIIKNSWGADWGREGYYYVYRGDGTCGLNTMCTSATVTKQ